MVTSDQATAVRGILPLYVGDFDSNLESKNYLMQCQSGHSFLVVLPPLAHFHFKKNKNKKELTHS